MLKRSLVLAALLQAALACPARADLTTTFTFETSQPTTAGPYAAEIGTGTASAFHAGTSTYSSPAGNGSAHSYSSTNWAVGDYYQFTTSTLGNSGIRVSWDQTSSGTGPGNFALFYSTDGTNFTQFGSQNTVLVNGSPNIAWSAGTNQTNFTFSDDLSGITALNNQATVYFRVEDTSTTSANGGTTSSAGTDRVDNFTITNAAVPEPTSFALTALAAGVFGAWRWKRRRLENVALGGAPA